MSNGRFIKAMSNGRFIKALAVLSRQKQPSGQTSRFEPRIASSTLPFIKALAVLSRQKQPSGQTSRFQPRIASSVYQRPGQAIFSKGRPNSRFIKAMSNGRFMKALAVLSRQKQPSGQTSRFEPRIASSILARAISLSASGPPSHQKQAQCFIKAKSNSRFIKAFARSSGLRIPYYPAQSVYQRPPSYFQQKQVQQQFYQGKAQWPFYQSLCRFITAEAAKWQDI